MKEKIWRKSDWKVIKSDFEKIEKTTGYKFPEEFKNFILENQTDGLSFDYMKEFEEKYKYEANDFFKSEKDISCLNGFNNFNNVEDFIDVYYIFTKYPPNYCIENNIQEQDTYDFPKEIILFAYDGGWDFAFDFRGGRKEGKIPVVWIVYDGDVDKRIKYFTDSFEDFLECMGNPEKDVVDEYIKG